LAGATVGYGAGSRFALFFLRLFAQFNQIGWEKDALNFGVPVVFQLQNAAIIQGMMSD